MREGGCSCGEVRYRLTDESLIVHACHCLNCQRQTGSAFVINALIETDRIEVLSGDTVAFCMPTDSGRPHDVHRCTVCGTTLWSDYGRRGVMRFLRATTLDDRGALSPDVHIYTRSKLPWVKLPPDVPAFEAYYDMNKLWPAESQERRRALLGRG
jgi:hypothetical protein